MSRNYKNNSQLIAWAITALIGIIKFLIEVHKKGLWKEFIISTSIFSMIWYILHLLYTAKNISFSIFSVILIIVFIIYCAYWSNQFSNSPYQQFSRFDIKKNSYNWSAQEWWWTLNGWEFEQEVAKIFISMGYNATVTRATGDGGVDIILEKDGIKSIVQCKHHNAPVGPNDARALWGCKEDFDADEVILIASSGITKGAADYIANKQNYKVYILDDIIEMSQSIQNITDTGISDNTFDDETEVIQEQYNTEETHTVYEQNEVLENISDEQYEENNYEESSEKNNIENQAHYIAETYNISFDDAIDLLSEHSYEQVIAALEDYEKQSDFEEENSFIDNSSKSEIEIQALRISEIYNVSFENAIDLLSEHSYEQVIDMLESKEIS